MLGDAASWAGKLRTDWSCAKNGLRRVDDRGARRGARRFERALETDDTLLEIRGKDLSDIRAGGEAPAGLLAVHVANTDAGVGGLRHEPLDHRFEVFVLAGAEAPLIEDGKLDRARPGGPRGFLRADAGWILAEPGEAPRLKDGDDERAIRRVGRELARARQAADDAIVARIVGRGE